MVSSPNKYIFHNEFEYLSLAWQIASLSPGTGQFFNSDISQGSVTTFVRCGGIFNDYIIANLLSSLSLKEL